MIPDWLRGRILHGWAFRNHDDTTVQKIRAFLESGDPNTLAGTDYANLAERCERDPAYLGKPPRGRPKEAR